MSPTYSCVPGSARGCADFVIRRHQMAEMMATELGESLVIPKRIDKWRRDAGEISAVKRSLVIAGDAMETWMGSFRTDRRG